jgi:hypothetical protein
MPALPLRPLRLLRDQPPIAAALWRQCGANRERSMTKWGGACGRYLDFYNGRRQHSSLDGITPRG